MAKIFHQLLKSVIRGMSKRRMSRHTGTMRVPGIQAPVEVLRDAQGVPYIYAKSREDLFFGQGWAHAQDRLWQMDINRRLAMGTLSEVLGPGALDTDRMSRTFGFARLGQADHALIDDGLKAAVAAYCAGVNAWKQQIGKKLPVEFRLAGYQPDDWEPIHVMAFIRLMTLQLSNGWGHELIRARLYKALGPELLAELDIRHAGQNPPTLPNGIEVNQLQPDGKLKAIDGPFLRQVGGSNAWALTGSRTDTGKPYLCSDPHLSMLMPAIWYQIYLEAPDFRVQGVSIPGMPLVQIGHNEHISWGVTLAFSDIQDIFVEKFESADSYRYACKGEWLEAEVVEEKIYVKKQAEPHVEKVVMTRNGPIISDFFGSGPQKLALNSSSLKSAPLAQGWAQLDTATGWDDFVRAAQLIEAPGLNLVYADVEGNIGYWMTGKTPIRAKGQGEMPQPGWTGEYDWVGYVPADQMPHSLNPERGYIISANNKVVSDDFPYFMGNIWMNGYRAARIEEMLATKQVWARDDFPAIHMDVLCRPGLLLAAHYRKLGKTGDAEVDAGIARLLEWDGRLTAETIGGTIYQVCRRFMGELLLRSAVDEETYLDFAGRGVDPVLFKVTEFQGKDTNALLDLLSNPASKMIQKAGGKQILLTNAMKMGLAWLREHHGADPAKWQWGRLHMVRFQHAMAVKPPMDKVFNGGPVPTHGDTDTVCQTAVLPNQPFEAGLSCPSYRQIVDMADFNRSLWVKPPGQSGQLGSKNYTDQIDAWLNGRYFPMYWDREKVETVVEKRQNLVPVGGG